MLNGPSATYKLIHAFLVKRGHSKAALSVKKAAKGILDVLDNSLMEGPYLEDIVRQWQSLDATTSPKHRNVFSASSGALAILQRRYAADL
jgi:hypothetical protein